MLFGGMFIDRLFDVSEIVYENENKVMWIGCNRLI